MEDVSSASKNSIDHSADHHDEFNIGVMEERVDCFLKKRVARVPPNNARPLYTRAALQRSHDAYHKLHEEQTKEYVCDASEIPLQPKPEVVDDFDSEACIHLFMSRLNWSLIRMEAIRGRPVKRKEDRYFLKADEEYDATEHVAQMKLYSVDKLNPGQRLIWEYILGNPNKFVLIQAGPGCGKSFVLKTVAFNHLTHVSECIIYKKDLLFPFRFSSRRFTVASFVMQILKLKYYQMQALDKHFSSRMNTYDFMLVMIGMLRRATMLDFRNSIVYLDEYTIIPKPMLVLIYMELEFYGVGVVICGDKNQLQNIHNSAHALMSAYGLSREFAHAEFTLETNERCSDDVYNNLVEYFCQFSSTDNLTEQAFAAIATLFPLQCLAPPTYHQTHLAATHQDLADLISVLVLREECKPNFYFIDQSNCKPPNPVPVIPAVTLAYLNRAAQCNEEIVDPMTGVVWKKPPKNDKFVLYLTLAVGGQYFVNTHSEFSRGTLVEYSLLSGQEYVIMKMNSDGSLQRFPICDAGPSMFEAHRDFMMGGASGKMANFPIYPSNFMTIHKCQGCTITDNLDLLLMNCNFQHLYVALSRVTQRSQIARIQIPFQMQYLTSAVINFKQLCFTNNIRISDVREGIKDFMFYPITDYNWFNKALQGFFMLKKSAERMELREQIAAYARDTCKARRLEQPRVPPPKPEYNNQAIYKIIKFRKLFIALSRIGIFDRNVWLYEFLLRCPENAKEFQYFLQCDKNYSNAFGTGSKPMGEFQYEERVNEPQNIKYGYGCDFNKNRKDNILTQIGNLENTPKETDSIVSYIEHIAVEQRRSTPEECRKYAHLQIKFGEKPDTFMETTAFCKKVYFMHMNNLATTELTLSWLIDELNTMLKEANDALDADQKKKEADKFEGESDFDCDSLDVEQNVAAKNESGDAGSFVDIDNIGGFQKREKRKCVEENAGCTNDESNAGPYVSMDSIGGFKKREKRKCQ